MRDAHLLKEKVQLSLDNRQVASLVVGGLAILGVVFGLGVVVGRKLAPPPLPPEIGPADVLAEVDRKAKDPSFDPARDLTYQETLTKPSPAQASPERSRAQPIAEPPPAFVANEEASRALPRKPEPVPEPAATTNTTIVNAFDRVRAQPERPRVPAPGEFTIQVSASQDKFEVDGVVQKLRAAGYSPYVVDAQIPGKGRWYRVRLGHFGTKVDAERYLKDFKRETRSDAIVTAAR
jgi:DedD protein